MFGITSGTAGCTEDGLVQIDEAVEVLAAVNLNNLEDWAELHTTITG